MRLRDAASLMGKALKRLTLCIIVGMIVFMPTSIAQVLKRSICGKVALNTTEAVARTEVLLYYEGLELFPGAAAEPDGTFCIDNYVGDLSQSIPAQLYVMSSCRLDDVTLVDVPFWSPLRKIPRFSGKRITVGPGNATSVGSVNVQIVYGHLTLTILNHQHRPLLTETSDWSPLWIRVRDQNGVRVHESGLSPAEIERSVNLKESRINLALPTGTWRLEVALAGVPPGVQRGGKWRKVPGKVKIESCGDPVDVTLTVSRM
jgi:hypothetical protein